MKLHDDKNTSIKASRLVAVQDPQPAPRQIVTLTLILLLDYAPAPQMNLNYKNHKLRETDRSALDAALDLKSIAEEGGPAQ